MAAADPNPTQEVLLEDCTVIVIDHGSKLCKAGIGGYSEPQVNVPSVVGRPRDDSSADFFVGAEAQSKREILSLRYPIEHGFITHWDDMEKIWQHMFKELAVNPAEHPFLLSEPLLNPEPDREKLLEYFFEKFNCPALYVENQPVLTYCYSRGSEIGTYVESTDSCTRAFIIACGHVLRHTISPCPVAGRDLTDYMMRMLNERGYSFTTPAEREIARDIKEKLAYVPRDYDKEMRAAALTEERDVERTYELPDGQFIAVGSERFRCAEPLFRPDVIGIDGPSLQQAIYNAIRWMDNEWRKSLFRGILITGGNLQFPGIVERMQREVQPYNHTEHITVLNDYRQDINAWIGGSTLASLSTFEYMWISKEEYEETGARIVHRKCF